MRADDAYKWLFQATRGGEHAIDREGALSWLQDEWKTLTPPRAGERERNDEMPERQPVVTVGKEPMLRVRLHERLAHARQSGRPSRRIRRRREGREGMVNANQNKLE